MSLCRAPAKHAIGLIATLLLTFAHAPPLTAADQGGLNQGPVLPRPVMENDSINLAQSGSIKLIWRSTGEDETAPAADFELQEATTKEFTDAHTYYHGPDLATYISGLPEGTYYYRVRLHAEDGSTSEWSKPIMVEVEHHSLSLAWFLFAVGGIVFALTVAVVVGGTRKNRVEESHSKGGAR